MKQKSKKIFVGIAGGIVTLLGLVLVPYPGPGWLVVFAGLGILATEFEFAAKWLDYVKAKYDAWTHWIKRQNMAVRILVLGLTGAVVVVTVWLVNGFGVINNLLSLNQEWLISPLFK